MSDNTAKPDRPFHLWLQDVCIINLYADLDGIGGVLFWWNLYRRNYSPVGAVSYNMSGNDIPLPDPKHCNKNCDFKGKPFPAEPWPDIMADLGLV